MKGIRLQLEVQSNKKVPAYQRNRGNALARNAVIGHHI
jgi:hypothetical protein